MQRKFAQLLIRLVALLLGACIVVIVAVRMQQPQGWLAFTRFVRDAHFSLHLMDVPRHLMQPLGRAWLVTADELAWSNDGRLAFRTISPRGTSSQILVFDANSVTFSDPIAQAGLERFPTWSPDGRLTLAGLYDSDELNIYQLDDTGLTQMTADEQGGGMMPVWSRDGRLAFAYQEGFANYDVAIYNPADGSWLPVEHMQDGATRPVWSANGLLAFQTYGDNPTKPPTLTLYDGVSTTDLGYISVFQAASWSADGRLAYIAGLSNEIMVYDTRTHTTTNVTNSPFAEGNPSWSPAGDLLYKVEADGSSDLYLLNFTTNTRINLTHSPQREYFAVWMP